MNIPILRVRDEQGNIIEIPALKGADYVLKESDKQEIAEMVVNKLTSENWTFTLEDGSTVTKKVYVG